MKNIGKRFEEDFRKSVPDNVWFYRFRDSNNTFYGGNEQLRFTPSNIADNMLYYENRLYLNELKHHHGKSIPLGCIEGNKTKEKQIKEMLDANMFFGIKSHIIVFFSDLEKCYALPIIRYIEFKRKNERKSIPVEYFEENAVNIPVSKLKVSYRFNLNKFLNNF